MNRKAKPPQDPKPVSTNPFADAEAREARIRGKTVRDLASMLRAIVKSRGKGENRDQSALKPSLLDAFQLAARLDPCKQTRIEEGVNEYGGRSITVKTRRIDPPDPATGLLSNILNRTAVLLMNVMDRMKRGDPDAGENVELLAIADNLDRIKKESQRAEAPVGNWSRPMTLTDLADRIFKNPRAVRKLKNVYGNKINMVGRKSWQINLDGFPENIRQQIEKA